MSWCVDPYAPHGHPPAPPGQPRGTGTAMLAAFLGALLGLALLAAIVVLASQPPPPAPPCPPEQPCAPPPSLDPVAAHSPAPTAASTPSTPESPPATLPAATASPGATPQPDASPTTVLPTPTPASDSPPVVAGREWRSETLGYSFEYEPEIFELRQSDDDLAVFAATFLDAQVVVQGVPADTSPAQLMDRMLERVDRMMIGRARDDDDYDALLGPSIGYIRGEGAVYSGTLLSADGTPAAPGGVTIVAASDGQVTAAVVVIVGAPDARVGSETHQHVVRSAADHLLKTFDWAAR